MLYDLHIHSCLSPCANDDMTPSTIAGLAKLAGAELISIADHNSALNLPAAAICCKAYGLQLLPAIEVNTAEEIHLLCYFPTVQAAMTLSDELYDGLAAFEYDENIWGRQLVMDEDDNIIANQSKLLTGASAMGIYKVKLRTESLGGIAVPAHTDKDSYSLLSVLGFCPDDLDFTMFELKNPLSYASLCAKGLLPEAKAIISSSDAHCMEDIACKLNPLPSNSPLLRLLI